MDRTLEVRWFYDGSPPQSVLDWFMALHPQKESRREDVYLISDDPSLNVKLRGSRIQLKRRNDRRTRIAFSDGVNGYCEPWLKWSFPLATEAPDPTGDGPSRLWRPVTKVRYRRAYPPAERRTLLPMAEETDAVTASVELTLVRSGPHEAWTICMETEGRTGPLADPLYRVGRYVFNQGRPPRLDKQHSYGYARWLKHIYSGVASTEDP